MNSIIPHLQMYWGYLCSKCLARMHSGGFPSHPGRAEGGGRSAEMIIDHSIVKINCVRLFGAREGMIKLVSVHCGIILALTHIGRRVSW